MSAPRPRPVIIVRRRQAGDRRTLPLLRVPQLLGGIRRILIADYRGGKTKLMGWFVGQVMKASGGKANPRAVNQALRARLED